MSPPFQTSTKIIIAAVLVSSLAIFATVWVTSASSLYGTVWGWGYNGYGQVGDGTSGNGKLSPVKINLDGIKAVAGGHSHSLAVKTDGSLWAWGSNEYGQLGDGTITDRYTPVLVKGLSDVIAAAGSYTDSLALKSDGTVWAWGYRGSPLGSGTTESTLPGQVTGLSGVTSIALGAEHSIALKSDGTVWCWGDNTYGELGDGTRSNRSAPVQVAGLYNVVAVSAGNFFSVALKNDGTVWTWGYGSDGELGNGTYMQMSLVPVQIIGLSGVTKVSTMACASHLMALKSDGTIWTWGKNGDGELGDGTMTNSSLPVQVSGMTGISAIAAGGHFCLALKSDGTLWGWGSSLNGELGNGSTSRAMYTLTPVQAAGLTGIVMIACGFDHSLAITATSVLSSITSPKNGDVLPAIFGLYSGAPGGLSSHSIIGVALSSYSIKGVEVSTDNGTTWNAASSNSSYGSMSNWIYHWTPPALGSYTLKSRATDSSGNVETPGTGITVTVSDKPGSNITMPISGAIIPAALGSYSITGNAVDRGGSGLKGVDVSTDGGATWSAAQDLSGNGSFTSWVYHLVPLPLGGHSLVSRAKDNTGWVEIPNQKINLFVDGTIPVSYISSPAASALVGGTRTYAITGKADDGTGSGIAKVEVSTDGGITWSLASGTTSWSFPWTLPSVADSFYTIQTRATDFAGNVESPGPGVKVEVDTVPPSGSLSINSDALYTNSTTVNLVLSATDPGHNCTAVYPQMCSVSEMRFFDGSTWHPWEPTSTSRQWQLSAGDGVKDVRVCFLDLAGNVSANYEKTITLDTTPPTAVISQPSSNATITAANCTISGTASDGSGSGIKLIEISTDGGMTWNAAAGTSSWSYNWNIPAAGSYTIICRTTDNVGNMASSAASVNVSAKSTITLNRTGISLNCNQAWNKAVTEVSVNCSPWAVNYITSPSQSWISGAANPADTSKYILFANLSGLVGSYGASVTFNSPYALNAPVLNLNLTVASSSSNPELQHYNWAAYLSGGNCSVCHQSPQTFLASGYLNNISFCMSCHNSASTAHGKSVIRPVHSVLVNVTSGGNRMPSYGNITGEYSNEMYAHLPGGKITCVTCHNAMRKTEDCGRVWEYTYTPDNVTYYLNGGGWPGLGSRLMVYRDNQLWSGPSMVKAKQAYLVDPSEYTYNEDEGSIKFKTAQSASVYIYATLDFPYIRVSQVRNRMCQDCHNEITHEGANCLNCHTAHYTSNIKGIRQNVRTLDYTTMPVKFLRYTGANSFANGTSVHTSICVVCHTTTKYYRRDGSQPFANHSGGMNYDRKDCTACHSHASGFAKYN